MFGDVGATAAGTGAHESYIARFLRVALDAAVVEDGFELFFDEGMTSGNVVARDSGAVRGVADEAVPVRVVLLAARANDASTIEVIAHTVDLSVGAVGEEQTPGLIGGAEGWVANGCAGTGHHVESAMEFEKGSSIVDEFGKTLVNGTSVSALRSRAREARADTVRGERVDG